MNNNKPATNIIAAIIVIFIDKLLNNDETKNILFINETTIMNNAAHKLNEPDTIKERPKNAK